MAVANRFDVVRVRVGVASVPLLDAEELNGYRRLVEAFVGDWPGFVGGDRPWRCITSHEANSRPETVYQALIEALDAAADDADLLVVDLTLATLDTESAEQLLRGTVLARMAQAVGRHLEKRPGTGTRVVVLLPEAPPPGDLPVVILQGLLNEGRVQFVGDSGDAVPPLSLPGAKAAYRRAISARRGDDLVRLRNKLVKRKGWFRRGGDRYVRYYYDLSRAQEELDHELSRRIRAIVSPGPLIYHSELSDWLFEPLRSAVERLAADGRRLELHRSTGTADVMDAIASQPDANACTIIIPVIDTGETLRRLVAAAKEARPGITAHVLGILSTQGNAAADGTRRLGGPHAASAQYLLQVEQIHVATDDRDCDLSHLPLDADRVGDEPPNQFNSYQYWDVVRELPVITEKDRPGHRARKSPIHVPDYNSLLTERGYGPWLATRLWSTLEGDVTSVPRDALVVCPEGEQTSGTLANYLADTLGVRVIHVPRPDIDLVTDAKDPAAEARRQWAATARPAWQQMLQSAGSVEVVLLDDFILSGTTIRSLRALLQAGGFLVTAIACLSDHSTDGEQENIRSLYAYARSSPAAGP